MKTHVTLRSSNAKTGPLAVTYRTQESCPTTCAFFENGCYARGRIFGIARKFGRDDLNKIHELATTLDPGQGLRLNVSGDFLTDAGDLDQEYVDVVNALVRARPDVRVIAYTHAWRTLDPSSFAFGVNASCETTADVAEARKKGWGTVMVDGPEGEIVAGTRVVRCPAEYRDDTTCASCMLCSRTPDLPTTVSFRTHGAGAHKASVAVSTRKKQHA